MVLLDLPGGDRRGLAGERFQLIAGYQESLVDIGKLLCASRLRLHRFLSQMINHQFRNDEAEAHRQYDFDCGHTVSNCRAYEQQRRRRAVGKLYEPARHPEYVNAWNHRHYGSEADGRERHMPTAGDWSENQRDDETGDQSADRGTRAKRRK
jgi:hypothetical protein